jgi:uncharacterized protein (TIGR00297 family)
MVLLVLIAISLWISEHFGKRGHIPALLSRKLLHLAGVGSLAVSPLFINNYVILAGVATGFSIILFILVKRRLLVADIYNRPSWGIALFPLSFLVLWLFWGRESLLLVVLPMLILTFADAGAAIVGGIWAKRRYNLTGDEKSIIGSLAFASITFICLWVILPVWQLFNPEPDPVFNRLSNLSGFEKSIIFLAIALFTAVAEGVTSGGWDNVTVPLSVAWLLPVFAGSETLESVIILPVMLVFTLFGWLAYNKEWLDGGGAVTAALLGFIIWVGGGWPCLILIGIFFISGSLLGKIKVGLKTESDDKKGKPRDYMQVLCNGGVAGACVLWNAFDLNQSGLPMLLFGISVAISTADTWSSEIGTRFGGKVVNIIGFKELPSGVSGGISLQGTVAGLAGALVMGLAGWVLTFDHLDLIIAGGFIGMLLDSVLGSMLQAGYLINGKWSDLPSVKNLDLPLKGFKWMTNDLVNLCSNLIITLFFGLILFFLWKGG